MVAVHDGWQYTHGCRTPQRDAYAAFPSVYGLEGGWVPGRASLHTVHSRPVRLVSDATPVLLHSPPPTQDHALKHSALHLDYLHKFQDEVTVVLRVFLRFK